MSDVIYLEDYPDLKKAGRATSTEQRFYCPVCEQRRGKPDNDGKLYFNTVKRVGYCFKCGVILKSNRVMNKEELQEFLSYKEEQEAIVKPAQLSLDFTESVLDDKDALEYLLGRGLDIDTIKRFNIRSCKSPVNGIVFNNGVDKDNVTDFLQIRNYTTTNHARRFLNVRNVLKPMVLLPFAGEHMIMCEGFMSAFSAYQNLKKMLPDEDYCPLVCTGKSISRYQMSQLQEHCKKYQTPEIIVCLDGGFNKEALKVAEQLTRGITDISVYIMRLPDETDPNDLNLETFVETWNSHTYRYKKSMSNLLLKQLNKDWK